MSVFGPALLALTVWGLVAACVAALPGHRL
jgi:hypothetical protein